jgi:NAD(P)-dependent dehydrogenase (short-subunit alcohol dehydrogenase family)
MTKWNQDQIPAQNGRVAIVTGANSGIGFETAKALAEKGAEVILACRSEQRGLDALERIRAAHPEAKLRFLALDLADLDQVSAFAERFRSHYDRLDLLINNAGVMVPPTRAETAQGFELQFGVNHLGHFALTGHLVEVLERTEGARVVNVSSMAHRGGKMRWDDLQWEKSYQRWPSYGQSKLANLLFTLELGKRLEGTGVTVTAAHPGWTATNLQKDSLSARIFNPVVAMPPAQGALPTLYAAIAAEDGEYIGPHGLMEVRGYPAIAGRSARSRDEADAERLWDISEEMTGVRFLSTTAVSQAA